MADAGQHNRTRLIFYSSEWRSLAKTLKNHTRYWDGWLAVFGDYMPWGVHKLGGGTRDNYPPHSGRILDLKEGNASAVTAFKAQIEPELADGILIVTVSGHDPNKPGKGLPTLAAELASKGRRIDASSALYQIPLIRTGEPIRAIRWT
jgi:hypothetical protein